MTISPRAQVDTDTIGQNVSVGEFAVVRRDVVIGDDVTVHPHAVIGRGVVLARGVEVFPGAVVGREPKGTRALSRPPAFDRKVLLGTGAMVGAHAVIYCDVEIGSDTIVGDQASIREGCRIGNECVIGRFVAMNYNVVVGDRTKIMDHGWLAGNMTIGADVFISGGVLTANDNAMGAQGYDAMDVLGPTVQDRARIGVGAILLPGIVVGTGAVVGAGAVVTKDVSAETLVLGVPARIVKHPDR